MERFSMLLMLLLLVMAALPVALCGGSMSKLFQKHKAVYGSGSSRQEDDPGQPLFLTPYVESGDFDKARAMSQVDNITGLPSYSGFFTVDKTFCSNMFFWFFPAQSGMLNAPVLLWLQGGPGGSSLFGLFNENGPLYVDSKMEVHRRNVTWNLNYHMLYIDNPVGTGFSFTDKNGLSTNESHVARNLYSALTQFFQVFGSYRENDFYITGESYAGKYIPAIGYKIHMENQQSPKVFINLKGVAIGDGLCDPRNMLGGYADLAYNFGLADKKEAAFILSSSTAAISYIDNGEFMKAFAVFDMLLNGDIFPYPTYFYNITGSTNYFNILKFTAPPEFAYYTPYLNLTSTRKAIHVGSLGYGLQSDAVEQALINDLMQTVKGWLATLMDNYKVLLYNGQLDLIIGPPLTENFLEVLDWSGHGDYLASPKTLWKVDGKIAGYVRTVHNFMQVVVLDAGHILPFDQPERALNLIETFISKPMA